ncbi:uncharacterized protein KIAA0895-like homolog isoform X3 [Marmota marmota marmota]|uniref:uncharacterized protein KIAA0895-like homolog isoform X3 n=1 Tax=Marmota marmota marmota TaxID=9994 RepID=UPI002092A199|nr:uncharacterized protein KIAA0895-like homolog isoform X3 [Marmota marmota marmota]
MGSASPIQTFSSLWTTFRSTRAPIGYTDCAPGIHPQAMTSTSTSLSPAPSRGLETLQGDGSTTTPRPVAWRGAGLSPLRLSWCTSPQIDRFLPISWSVRAPESGASSASAPAGWATSDPLCGARTAGGKQRNKQFEYQEPMPTTVLEKYCEASGQFIHQAVGIIEAVLEKFGTYEHFEAATGGQLLTKCQIWSIVRKYMQKEGCVGEVVVQLSEDLLSQAVMMVENSRPTLAINLTGARQYWLEGMLRHEIGTHYLRGVNNAQQPWHSTEGRLQYGLRPANPTEEGLASLHSVLFRKQPFLWRAALLYYTIHRAARMSFRQLFQDLARYVQDADVRWEYCVRAKRGQTDTSKPGCFSKDQVYLDGIVRILRHRQTIDFPLLTSLGKVSYEDVDHLRPHGVLDNTRVPHFMQDLERYRQQLEHIMATNRLDEAELGRLLPD